MSDTTLTPSEKAAIRASWDVIYGGQPDSGNDLTKRLFTEIPETKTHFKYLDGIDDLEVACQNKRLQYVNGEMMKMLNSFVDALDNPDTLMQRLTALGTAHGKRKIPAKFFEALEPVLVPWIEARSADAYSAEVKVAWLKAWGIIQKGIVDGINAATTP